MTHLDSQPAPHQRAAVPSSTPPRHAEAYLPEEPILVLHAAADGVEALVNAVRDTWRVRWSPGVGWSCSCPARTIGCGHIGAVRSIVVLESHSGA